MPVGKTKNPGLEKEGAVVVLVDMNFNFYQMVKACSFYEVDKRLMSEVMIDSLSPVPIGSGKYEVELDVYQVPYLLARPCYVLEDLRCSGRRPANFPELLCYYWQHKRRDSVIAFGTILQSKWFYNEPVRLAEKFLPFDTRGGITGAFSLVPMIETRKNNTSLTLIGPFIMGFGCGDRLLTAPVDVIPPTG